MKRARPTASSSAAATTGIASATAPSSPPKATISSRSNAAGAVPTTANARHARRRGPGGPRRPPSPTRRLVALISSAIFFIIVLAVIEYELVTHLFGSPAQSARSYGKAHGGRYEDDDDRIPPADNGRRLQDGSRLRGRIDDDAAVGVDEGSVSITSMSNNDPTQGGVYEPIVGQSSRMPRPIVIAGPSGVGKGTLINKLLEHYTPEEEDDEDGANKGGDYFGFSVSHTTRGARPGEIDGIHYHFSTRRDVQAGIDNGDFIEYNEVHGNLYGTSFDAVNTVSKSGRIAILDIDAQGVRKVKKSSLDPYYIFIAPPSMELLEKRLRDRGTETEEAIQIRTANARAEVEYGQAPGNFDYVLVNDDLDAAFKRLLWQLRQVYPHLPASV